MSAPVLVEKGFADQRLTPKNGEAWTGSSRRIATLVGVLYIIGTVAGIASAVIAGPLLSGSDYLTKIVANANSIIVGALCVLTMGMVLALIPALMFPILRRLSEPLAIGYVIFRGALETLGSIGIAICWLLLLAAAREASSGAAQFQGLAALLVNAQNPILSNVSSIFFSLGALMLYLLMYQARLIPRWISGWGLLAAVLTLVPSLSALFGINWDMLKYVMLPQEMVMAVWLIVKGFDTSSIPSDTVQPDARYPMAT
jgi:hypothetical protein